MMMSIGRRLVLLSAPAMGVATTVAVAAGSLEGKRVLHIDSYHQGNEWNDRIAAAVQTTLAGTGVELKIIHLDTKRNPSPDFGAAAALRANAVIRSFQPDVVTASDDNAAAYVIAPYYRDGALPFVFCGLNWDASVYGLPARNVTGMVEVSPIPQIISLLRRYAKGERLGYLTEDTSTKRKELAYHRRLFNIRYDRVYLVNNYAAWKAAFRRAQDEVDMLLILGVAAVEGFDDEDAARFAEEETRIPTGTDFGWLMHVSFLGVGKVPEEQGRWAAKAALRILEGVPPSQIPVSYNREGKLYVNPAIATRLGVDEWPALAEPVP